jgi:outer membrane protein TolC
MSKDLYKNKIAMAWADYFPTINAGISYSRNDMLVTNFAFPMQKYNMYNVPNIGFSQLIFDFGKTSANAKIARKTFEAADESLQANINDVIYQVKQAYYNLLYCIQQVEVYEGTVANFEVHLKQAQAYYEIGTKPKIDVLTAAYNLDNAKMNLIQAKNAVETAYAQLNNAMGIPDYSQYSIKERLNSKKYDVIFDDLLATAYEQRPALLASKKRLEGSEILIKASKVAFLPDLRGFGNYTRGGKTPSTDYGYQIGAQITYSNTNLYLLKKQVDEAKITYKKDKADYEVQRQTVYLEVKQAYIQFKNAQESIPVALSSMKRAKEQHDLANGRYKVGLGDAVELKDAENTYRSSQLSYYNALTQYNVSAANLERVVGTPVMPKDAL